MVKMGNSLVVQWLGLHASIAGGPGSIPCQGTNIPQAVQNGQRKKKRLVGEFYVMCILTVLKKINCISIYQQQTIGDENVKKQYILQSHQKYEIFRD